MRGSSEVGKAGMRAGWVAGLLLGVLVLGGCSEPAFPRDAEGSLERITAQGVLRAGASENLPWIDVADDGTVSGLEATIVSDYADSVDATVEWTAGAESQLILALDEGRLDVVVGGIRSDSPWSSRAALTRAHAHSVGPDGGAEELVFALRLGENALLTNVERFLIDRGLEP